MMARKWKIEELSVVADPWNLKLKPVKLKGGPKLTLEKEREILSGDIVDYGKITPLSMLNNSDAKIGSVYGR